MLNPSAGRSASRRLSRAGLWQDVRPHAGRRCRRGRHPRAGRRCIERRGRSGIRSPARRRIRLVRRNSYDADMQRARRLSPLVQQGHAGSLAGSGGALRHLAQAMGTILVGMATPAEFEQALAAVNKGPLSQAALDSLARSSAVSSARHGKVCRRYAGAPVIASKAKQSRGARRNCTASRTMTATRGRPA